MIYETTSNFKWMDRMCIFIGIRKWQTAMGCADTKITTGMEDVRTLDAKL